MQHITFTSRFVLLLIILFAIFTIQIQGLFFGQWCFGAHQEYLTCGSACPLSCSDVRQARYHRPCTYQCVQGCFCKRGYARQSHLRSQCIPDWRC